MITLYDELPIDDKLYFIVEANHLFKASSKINKQIYVVDVVKYLERVWLKRRAKMSYSIYGAFNQDQSLKYVEAMSKCGIVTVDMKPQKSEDGAQIFFDTQDYLNKLIGAIPKGSSIVLIGFHHKKFMSIYEAVHKDYKLNIASFITQSQSGGLVSIPREFSEKGLVVGRFFLDSHTDNIIKEFRVQKALAERKNSETTKEYKN